MSELRQETGDLWDWHERGAHVVVPTNMQHSNGRAHMGAGLAKQAAARFPNLPHWYAQSLQVGVSFFADEPNRVLCLATKDDWRKPSTLPLIREGLCDLAAWHEEHPDALVAMPQLGCGLGGLRWEQVRPLVEELTPWAVVVTPPARG